VDRRPGETSPKEWLGIRSIFAIRSTLRERKRCRPCPLHSLMQVEVAHEFGSRVILCRPGTGDHCARSGHQERLHPSCSCRRVSSIRPLPASQADERLRAGRSNGRLSTSELAANVLPGSGVFRQGVGRSGQETVHQCWRGRQSGRLDIATGPQLSTPTPLLLSPVRAVSTINSKRRESGYSP